MKNCFSFSAALVFAISTSYSAIIWEQSFEDPASLSDYNPATDFDEGPDGHFTRTDDLSVNDTFAFSGIDGDYFFSMNDIDDADGGWGLDFAYIEFDAFSVSGYENLTFSGLFGAARQDNYNSTDWAWVAYRLDGTGDWVKGLQFNHSSADDGLRRVSSPIDFSDASDPLSNADSSENHSVGDTGALLDLELTEFSFDVPNADSIELLFAAHFDNENEPFALDRFRLEGDSSASGLTAVPEPSAYGLAAGALLIGLILRKRSLKGE